MTKHTCKNCNRIFEYCRGCFLSPIPHMDAGFCSKECYEASKIKAVPTVEVESIVEEIITEEVAEAISVENIVPVEEEVSVEVEAEAIAKEETPIEIPAIEAVTVVEPTIKKETNTYKKKKNKYKVHE